MRFNDILRELGLAYVMDIKGMKRFAPKNTDRLLELVREITSKNLKVSIDPDSDPDGMFSALIVKKMFDKLGYKNYEVNKILSKRHGITDAIVSNTITNKVKVLFILDSSTNSLELIKKLCDNDVYVVIIDHHVSDYYYENYPDKCIIINPRIEALYRETPYAEVSAGFLSAMVCDFILTKMGFSINTDLYIYGYVTIYSDICRLDNPYNISIVNKFCNSKLSIPKEIKIFMDERYDSLCRSFVSYKVIPRINALFRLEKFQILNSLFFEIDEMNDKEVYNLVTMIEDYYQEAKQLSSKIESLAKKEVYDSFVLLKLDNIMEYMSHPISIVKNFTGLACQSLSETHSCAIISLISVSDTEYKGSVRDGLNRNVLKRFKRHCQCGGHPSAFGFKVNKTEYQRWLSRISNSLNALEKSNAKEYYTIDADDKDIDEQLIYLASYNELSGTGSLPSIYVRLTLTSATPIKYFEKYTTITWNGKKVVSFDKTLREGDEVFIKPTLTKSGINYYVNTIK